MRIKYPIRYKFLAVTTLLLIFSVVAYLALASQIFKRDKVELVFDLNRSAVSSLASDLGRVFQSIGDKMKLVAMLSQDASEQSKAVVSDLLRSEESVVYMAASFGFKQLDQAFFFDKPFADTYGFEESFFGGALSEQRAVPFGEIQTNGEAIWNATIPNGPPLIGYGKSVELEVISEEGGVSAQSATHPSRFAIIAFVKADKLLKTFGESRLSEVVAVNQSGQVLLHPDTKTLTEARSFAEHPLFKLAISQKVKTGVSSFRVDGDEVLGAYSASQSGKLLVLAQVDGRVAFSAVGRLIERSLVFASIAITLAFLAAVFFSRSMTKPIQALVDAMSRVSDGELDTRIEIKTNDETALLASSFNSMIHDLRLSREQLEEANRDLERKVRDRTMKLEEQNVAVKRAQEALLQSTRLAAVGEVAGRAAHEVLNPLTSIVTRLEKVRSRIQQGPAQEVQLVRDIVAGWESDYSAGGLDLLVQNWRSPSSVDESITLWQEDFENIRHFEINITNEVQSLVSDTDFLLKESNRINKIVQSMRDLTRVRGDLRVLRASHLMKEAVKIMADLCHQEAIEIEQRHVSEDDLIQVDPDEFTQVATNLLRNSIQAIQAKGASSSGERGRIVVSSGSQGGVVQIDIVDNGIGIRSEDSGKLFEVQFSTKSKDEGTGIGLSISRRFIRAFGGDIRLLNSTWMEGCAFRITLPLAEAQDEEQKVAA